MKNLIKIFKIHRDTSFEKMKEYPEHTAFHEGRVDAFELAIHILELKKEKLDTKK